MTRETEAEASAARWFEMSNAMLAEVSLDGYLTRVNAAWTECLGYTAQELAARPYVEFIHPADVTATLEVAALLAGEPIAFVDFENRYLAKDGSWHWILWSARSDGTRVYAAGQDITARKALEAEREDRLRRTEAIARTDALSGLPNRRAWDEELRRELAQADRDGAPVSVALVDIDGFKQLNDERGHGAGDDLLRDAATAWRLTLRLSDFVARLGGDEFAVLLPGCLLNEAVEVMERMRTALPDAQTCSIGLAVWDGAEAPESIVSRADAALYAAKRSGRNRIVHASAPPSR
jgi:diguanylate cyclase (GGDEF)-like protein/PAS domain S-box-containing protein